jgi:hypothetical protein
LFLRRQVFCDVILSQMHVFWYFERALCLNLQGSLRLKSPCHFEMSEFTQLTTQCHTPEDLIPEGGAYLSQHESAVYCYVDGTCTSGELESSDNTAWGKFKQL